MVFVLSYCSEFEFNHLKQPLKIINFYMFQRKKTLFETFISIKTTKSQKRFIAVPLVAA